MTDAYLEDHEPLADDVPGSVDEIIDQVRAAEERVVDNLAAAMRRPW